MPVTAKSKKVQIPDLSTEEKILAAARKVFTKKGYSATRTRDIAEEAGINLALLNYYFRSKEKLFELIMFESAARFFMAIKHILNDPTSDLNSKINSLVEHYTELLLKEPNFPVFILSEIQARPERLLNKLDAVRELPKSVFFSQLAQALQKNKNNIQPLHLLVNILALTVFPFVAKPMLSQMFSKNEELFKSMMLERAQLIPQWIDLMLTQSSSKTKNPRSK